ncbi:MAG: hypothetical protein COB02_02285 [Candidatus Cloacimonadota bacterium]|nr:MAG: hypothetical protein COB02_02285 [Candidatus Cloacimonadota bacterium]
MLKYGLLKLNYRVKTFHVGKLSFNLFIHKTYKKNKSKNKVNDYIKSLRVRSLVSLNDEKQKAIDLHNMAGDYLDSNKKIEAYLLFHYVFSLFSGYDEVKKDWEIVRESISPLEKKLLDYYGRKKLQNIILDLGYLPFENIKKTTSLKKNKSQLNFSEIKSHSKKNGLKAMNQLLVFLVENKDNEGALSLYKKLYFEKINYEKKVDQSNFALEKYLYFRLMNKNKAKWYLKKSLNIFPKNKRAKNFANQEGLNIDLLTLNEQDRKFYVESF